MSVNFLPNQPVSTTSFKEDYIRKPEQNSVPKNDKQISPDKVLYAMDATSFKPYVTETNEITFQDDGRILADNRKMTIHAGKVQLSDPAFIELPANTKSYYTDTLLKNSDKIISCVFLAKNEDGTQKQVSMLLNKDNSISISSRNSFNSDFKPEAKIPNQNYDSLKQTVKEQLEKYGVDNLTQIAVSVEK